MGTWPDPFLARSVAGLSAGQGMAQGEAWVSKASSARYREVPAQHGLIGSMSRRGNTYDNATAESFIKTLKVEAVYLMDYHTFEDVGAHLPIFLKQVALCARISEPRTVRGSTHPAPCRNRSLNLSTRRGALHPVVKK